jgi:nicotinamidase-related amidase
MPVPPKLDPARTAVVAIDMHRGHLDPTVATMPVPADRAAAVVQRAAALLNQLRALSVPIVHVVTSYRDVAEIASNPFWKAIAEDPTKTRKDGLRHNLIGGPGPEIMPGLCKPKDIVVHGKKRYSSYHNTELEFVLRSRLDVDTVILAGINTNSCILCAAFDSTNRDFRVVVAHDAVDTMDGPDMHDFALRLMSVTCGWPMTNAEILAAFGRPVAAAVAE